MTLDQAVSIAENIVDIVKWVRDQDEEDTAEYVDEVSDILALAQRKLTLVKSDVIADQFG